MDAPKEKIPDSLRKLGEYGQIILFGSRACGGHRPDSDYDLLIIVDDDLTRTERLKLAKRVRVQLAQEFLDADVIVRTRKEVEGSRDRFGSITRNALENGFVIHG